jgi:hypothetical protein
VAQTHHLRGSAGRCGRGHGAKLKVLCTYNLDEYAAFETGLITVENALIGTTEFDTFSICLAYHACDLRSLAGLPLWPSRQ